MEEKIERVGPDRLVLKLNAGGPFELEGLSESLAALARIYARHYGQSDDANPPKLYITKLETGSIWAEIAPYAMMFGQTIGWANSAIVVADFTRRITNALKGFADITSLPSSSPEPSQDDARDLREFVRPLTGKKNASLGITHARYSSKSADREVVAEYSFTEESLNRAALNIDAAIGPPLAPVMQALPAALEGPIRKEVMLFFQQASRARGKEIGRTGDKAIVPDVSDKALPTYFRKGITDLKDQMVRGEENPLTNAFIVDVHVQYVNGEPKGYLVTEVHKVIPQD